MDIQNPLHVKSIRLRIVPLSYAQLLLYYHPDGRLESSLGCTWHPRILSSELAEALEQTILPAVARAKDDFYFVTLWCLIEKAGNRLVGDICFKGSPTAAGEVEIGYGTYPGFENKGYMTEAVGALVDWAFRQNIVRAIVAETVVGNTRSQKVLEKNFFHQVGQKHEMLQWRLEEGDCLSLFLSQKTTANLKEHLP